ncbi:hypothetical protein MUCCIDRAFT_84104 [Mucor lusitanicus CBS 277.49]|uniref:Alpha/beta hydrolase fold-3 domain-containing protein n=1 Tax=Mucor lusitanicus CBS 277.49 TaxID=747725 RepID=A0A162YKJ0_MUCCL|nr:hypothetical protein MUCCIDRAFT_84104 [Mucor lusitanicus CBS 277.49]
MPTVDTSFLSPIFKALVAQCPEAVDFDKVTVQQARAASNDTMQPDTEGPPVDTEKIEIPDQTDGHAIKGISSDEKLPALIFFPGGGFCFIEESFYVFLMSTFATDLSCIVIFVNYSLSPEVQFPVALNEAHSVVEFATNSTTASKFQIDPTRVAVGGDSAGGNLSAAVSLLAKQRNQLQNSIKHQILYYPCVDNDFSTESYKRYGEGFFFTRKMASEFLKCYAPAEELENMLLLPNKASVDDLVGLPPALLITCEADVLCDEGEIYGRKLVAANVPVSSFRVNGVIHGFLSSPVFFSDEAYHVIDMTKRALQSAFTINN